MRSINPLASWRWCLLAVLAVGCAHSSTGPAAVTPEPAPRAEVAPVDTNTAEARALTDQMFGPEMQATKRKQQKVRRLMALTGAEDTGRQMMEMMTSHFEKSSSIPPGFMEKFREVAQQESIVDMLVPVYMKHFSEEDLDAAITFHESPAGKRFLAAQPRVMEEAKVVGEQWGVRLAEKALRALVEEEERKARPARHEGQEL
ncbi:hypothetical protein BO221_07430 [Archangium sp. Cb G35]|uniref:DUF2059 domain-containing protein n=1 Tax=Archangium sp. Cb G35 TaxID=1920190 RepID=UPI000935C2FC|nr:DUF2059 domain-containing protein [Archangium sp. Cb G35]OJT25680.1 hypothetical protein BO221_07430 [Archangium sp. Cb G35]